MKVGILGVRDPIEPGSGTRRGPVQARLCYNTKAIRLVLLAMAMYRAQC